ncbi:MAG TPA: hypothetical protein DIW47_02010 [Bacteroidetes bacterium]|nr:hypothetical protein [Bacteroidota bacterium]
MLEYYQKHDLIYVLETGETYSNFPSLCNGWRCDTINGGYGSKMVYSNPYDTWSTMVKYHCGSSFAYYFYKEGKRFTGKISDSVSYGGTKQIEFEANCINGMLQGKGKFYFTRSDKNFPKAGEVKSEGSFEDGEMVGEWTHYEYDHNNDCFIDYKFFYVKDKAFPKKVFSFYSNGEIKSETEYVDDYLISYTKEYRLDRMNPKVKHLYFEKTLLENNKKDETYRGNGSIYSYKQYNMGQIELTGQPKSTDIFGDKRTGTWYYYNEKGEMTKEEIYQDGKLIETKNH